MITKPKSREKVEKLFLLDIFCKPDIFIGIRLMVSDIFIDMEKEQSCQCMSELLKVQRNVIKKHLDEHMFLRNITDRTEALETFIRDYGWIIREMYCVNVCKKKDNCLIAEKLEANGDLLKDHLKQLLK